MKEYEVNLTLAIELDDAGEITDVIRQLMYVPNVTHAKIHLRGINTYEKIQPSLSSGTSELAQKRI